MDDCSLKPEVSTETIDMERLRQLPSDTFGYAYAQFMDSHVRTCTALKILALLQRIITILLRSKSHVLSPVSEYKHTFDYKHMRL